MLEVTDLVKHYGATRALAGFTLRAEPGEVVGLAGLLGSGRSETVKAIFGTQRLDHGSVRIGGRRVPTGSPRSSLAAGAALLPEDRKAEGIVPTMSVVMALTESGRELGFPPESQRKAEVAARSALAGLDHMRTAGVRIAYGTDLLGRLYDQQCREFTIRREVFEPVEILRQATSIAAELLMMAGEIGCVAPGACADLLVVDGDPLADIGLLAGLITAASRR